MANTKLSDLSAATAPLHADLTYIVQTAGVGGVKAPLSKILGLARTPPGLRLTLTTALPVTTADVVGATTIYWTPYLSNCVSIYNGTTWVLYATAELSLALGTLAAAFQAYDVFVYDNAGTLTLEFLEWANATITSTSATPAVITWTTHGMSTGNSISFTNSGGALPAGISANTQYFITTVDVNTFKISTTLANVAAGTFVNTTTTGTGTHTGHNPQARATALVRQDGVWCKTGALTRLYLGTFFSTATTTTEDSYVGTSQSGGKRFLWNMYNRIVRSAGVIDTTDSWTYTTATWRQSNAANGNKVECFVGMAGDLAKAWAVSASSCGGATAASNASGVGIDATATNSAQLMGHVNNVAAVGSSRSQKTGYYFGYLAAGYHTIVPLEIAAALDTQTWLGDNGVTYVQTGLIAEVLA